MQCGVRNSRDGSRTLLLALLRGVLDQISGHRTLLVQPFLRGVADLCGGDGANTLRPGSDMFDAEAGGDRAAIPARQRRLVVLGVDGFGDQLGLDPLEIFGANRVLREIRDHAVDHLLDLRELDAGFWRDRDHELRRVCLLYTSPSPRDGLLSRMPSSA